MEAKVREEGGEREKNLKRVKRQERERESESATAKKMRDTETEACRSSKVQKHRDHVRRQHEFNRNYSPHSDAL